MIYKYTNKFLIIKEISTFFHKKIPVTKGRDYKTTWIYATDNEAMPQKAEREMRV